MSRLREAPVTATLLVLIACLFAAEWTLGAPPHHPLKWDVLLDPIQPNILLALGSITPDALRGHQYWRLVTAMFLHGNITHSVLNSWVLFQLGSLYETMFGSRRFALVYFATGICASITSAMHLRPDGASVGASGAILGVLGAFIFAIPRSRWGHERWAKFLLYQLIFWGVFNVTVPYFVPVIDNWAHVAGVASGLILGLVLPHTGPPPEPPSQRVVDVLPYEG